MLNLDLTQNVILSFEEILYSLSLAIIFASILSFAISKTTRLLVDPKQFYPLFLILIPTTTLTITIIKSSIALSLGLVGALSIVRFRTPIRSPYELILYFSLLTVGIAAKVDLTITIILIITLTITPFFISLVSNRVKLKKGRSKEKKQIFLNFSGKIKSTELQSLGEEKYVKNYTVEKKEGDFFHIKVFAFFDNLNEKNNFINKWQNSINSFDVSKEELNVN